MKSVDTITNTKVDVTVLVTVLRNSALRLALRSSEIRHPIQITKIREINGVFGLGNQPILDGVMRYETIS
jgi:hypothetical protein